MPLLPIVLWAQKKECIYLTIDLEDAENVKIDLKEDKLCFSGKKDKNEYEFELLFLKPINVEESKYSTTRNIKFKIIKQEKERWKTLNKDGKKHWIKCDWNTWVDTDEENKTTDFDDMAMNSFGGMGGMPDMSQLGNMSDIDFSKLGGMGGLGGMGNGEMPNFGGMPGMDDFKNMPNMGGMNDDDDDDDDSSSYSDSDSDEDSEEEKDEESKTKGEDANEKKEDCLGSKSTIDQEESTINDPVVEVQKPMA